MKQATLLSITPVHPGRGERSFIQVAIVLDTKTRPVATHEITVERALDLIESLAKSVKAVTR